jgi:hypothetical protein
VGARSVLDVRDSPDGCCSEEAKTKRMADHRARGAAGRACACQGRFIGRQLANFRLWHSANRIFIGETLLNRPRKDRTQLDERGPNRASRMLAAKGISKPREVARGRADCRWILVRRLDVGRCLQVGERIEILYRIADEMMMAIPIITEAMRMPSAMF